MRKILVLASYTRETLESGLWDTARKTWGSFVARYPNIRLYGYCPMSAEERYLSPHDTLGYIDTERSLVLCPQDDDLFSSFNRTVCAMRTLIQHLRKADYVLFTNMSTYINIPLINDFVQSLEDNDLKIYCGRVISAEYMSAPYSWCFYAEGSAILMKREFVNYIMDSNKWRKHIVENDHTKGDKRWLFYKRNVTDTAFAAIINDLLLMNDAVSCLELLNLDDLPIESEALDHTLFWQDWGQDLKKDSAAEMWPVMGSVDCRGTDAADTAAQIEEVHSEVSEYYEENNYQTDMRYIESYVDNPKTPVVTQSLDKPDCCIDDYEKVPFDDYHKWLEENSDIPNLEVNEEGHLVDVPEPAPAPKRPVYDQWGQIIPEGMTYAEYFNIPFWDHQCWYKHPWAGNNVCGCCQKEQLVYPEGSPSHQHDGPVDCGCSGSGSSSGSGGSSSKKDDKCYDWDVI